MRSLWQLSNEMEYLNDLLDQAEGDLSKIEHAGQSLDDYLANVEIEEAEKLENYYRWIMWLEMEASAAKAQADQWLKTGGVLANRAENARTRLVEHLKRTGQKKVRTTSGRFVCLVGNGGSAPIDWAPDCTPEGVSETHDHLVETKLEIDNKAVRAALEAGNALPFAKLGERGKHVEFKTK